MRYPDQRGASIIEVVIMSGVMVAMLTGFMSLMTHESKNLTYLEDKLSRVALERELQMQFADSHYCKVLLEGIAAPFKGQTKEISRSFPQGSQNAALEQVFQKRGKRLVFDQLALSRITLEGSDLISSESSGSMNLMFYPERIRKGGGPDTLRPIRLKTQVTIDKDGKITSCSMKNEQEGTSCKLSEGLSKIPSSVKRYVNCDEKIMGLGFPKIYIHTLDGNYEYKYRMAFSGTWANQLNRTFTQVIPHGELVFGEVEWHGSILRGSFLHMKSGLDARYQLNFQLLCQDGQWRVTGSTGNHDLTSILVNGNGGTPMVVSREDIGCRKEE